MAIKFGVNLATPNPVGRDGSIATQKTIISSSAFHNEPRMARSAASQPLLMAGPLDAGPYGRAPALRGRFTECFSMRALPCNQVEVLTPSIPNLCRGRPRAMHAHCLALREPWPRHACPAASAGASHGRARGRRIPLAAAPPGRRGAQWGGWRCRCVQCRLGE